MLTEFYFYLFLPIVRTTTLFDQSLRFDNYSKMNYLYLLKILN